MRYRLLPVVLMMSCVAVPLSGCEDYRYHRATRLYSDHRYEEAAVAYEELGSYEDSEEMVTISLYKAAYELTKQEDFEGALAIYEQIPFYRDVPERMVEAKKQIELQKYGVVVGRLTKKTWYVNGGSDNSLKCLRFRRGKGTEEQVYFDEKGRHTNGGREFEFMLDDTSIALVFLDGEERSIPYRLTKSSVELDGGAYLSATQLARGLRGCWRQAYTEHVFDTTTQGVRCLQIRKKHLKYEYAATSARVTEKGYYYHGPYRGAYTLGLGCFDTDLNYGSEWFFTVIDGEATLLHYGEPCERMDADELPGEDGYAVTDGSVHEIAYPEADEAISLSESDGYGQYEEGNGWGY